MLQYSGLESPSQIVNGLSLSMRIIKEQLMGNQHETLIPSRLKYITLLSHQINSTELKSTIGFNDSIYNNTVDYL